MHPILLKIGNLSIYSWGAAFVLSFAVALFISARRAPRFGIGLDPLLEFSLLILLSAMVGSRFWYVVNHLQEFKGQWLRTVNPFHDGQFGIRGLAMNGGVILVVISAILFAWFRRVDFVALGDTIAPAFLLGAGIQRLGGCFLSGCCFGLPTASGVGIIFPPEATAHSYFPGISLWPTQLFAAALGFLGFGCILLSERRFHFPGAALWSVLAYYSLERFGVDQFRYYPSPQILGTLGPLRFNTNHPILLAVFVLSLLFWLRGWRKARFTSK